MIADEFDHNGEGGLGENWTAHYLDQGTGSTQVDSQIAVWFPGPNPAPTSVTIACRTCGHQVALHQGDKSIPAGDPRLCTHLAGGLDVRHASAKD